MNQKFFELNEEKRLAIINAGLEVFSKNDYKHALTDDIAAKAGISKGLLFYYFHNKLELYQYLAQYSARLVMKLFEKMNIIDGKDFFDAIKLAVLGKMEMMSKYPYIYGFSLRYYQNRKEIVGNSYEQLYAEVIASYNLIKRADISKFKAVVDPEEVWNIIYWMSQGYMDRYQDLENVNMKEIQDEYFRYLDIIKENFYREEFI